MCRSQLLASGNASREDEVISTVVRSVLPSGRSIPSRSVHSSRSGVRRILKHSPDDRLILLFAMKIAETIVEFFRLNDILADHRLVNSGLFVANREELVADLNREVATDDLSFSAVSGRVASNTLATDSGSREDVDGVSTHFAGISDFDDCLFELTVVCRFSNLDSTSHAVSKWR